MGKWYKMAAFPRKHWGFQTSKSGQKVVKSGTSGTKLAKNRFFVRQKVTVILIIIINFVRQ